MVFDPTQWPPAVSTRLPSKVDSARAIPAITPNSASKGAMRKARQPITSATPPFNKSTNSLRRAPLFDLARKWSGEFTSLVFVMGVSFPAPKNGGRNGNDKRWGRNRRDGRFAPARRTDDARAYARDFGGDRDTARLTGELESGDPAPR